jgi:Purple acid Phosphatase, N-terminal domain/Calcineurin-like phosphoesterase
MLTAGGAGLLATAAVATAVPATAATGNPASASASGDGTPEQIHLTWGNDPARAVVVSWSSPGKAAAPRVHVGERVIHAEERPYTDGINGETVYTYHARVGDLRPGKTYGYSITADNDTGAADPFTATFTTAPEGRAPFRFTSYGDLATPNAQWVLSYGQATYAVAAVESFQPLFHLLNGDLCYADLNPAVQPQVWRDFGNNNQSSAASRPWMPAPGNHEIEFNNGPQGFTSYLTRYTLPSNGLPEFEGRWYSFQVGSVLFVSLSADDVVYQDAGAFVAGPAALIPAASTGNPPIEPGTSLYIHGYSRGEQTRWLERTLGGGGRGEGGGGGGGGMEQPPPSLSPPPVPPPPRTGRSTGSSSRCTSALARRPRTATAPTRAFVPNGYRCSTSTRLTWCCPGTTTTTSGPSPCAALTTSPAPRPRPARRWTPGGHAR